MSETWVVHKSRSDGPFWLQPRWNDEWDTPLIEFKRQYGQLCAPEELPYPSVATLANPEYQATFYKEVLRDEAHSRLPPSRYRLRVLKKIVDDLQASFKDSETDVISDEIMELYSKLMAVPQKPELEEANGEALVNYTLPCSPEHGLNFSILERRSTLAMAGTTGFRTWDAALHLGSFFSTSLGKMFIQRKRVIELGAGTGFLSVLCAKFFNPKFVLATDGSEEVLQNLRANIFTHNTLYDTDVCRFEWGATPEPSEVDAECHAGKFDLIIGADVTYDPPSIVNLLKSIRAIMDRSAKCIAIIAAKVRNEETVQAFLEECVKSELDIKEIRKPQIKETPQLGFYHSTATPFKIFLLSPKSTPYKRAEPSEYEVDNFWHITKPKTSRFSRGITRNPPSRLSRRIPSPRASSAEAEDVCDQCHQPWKNKEEVDEEFEKDP